MLDLVLEMKKLLADQTPDDNTIYLRRSDLERWLKIVSRGCDALIDKVANSNVGSTGDGR